MSIRAVAAIVFAVVSFERADLGSPNDRQREVLQAATSRAAADGAAKGNVDDWYYQRGLKRRTTIQSDES